MATQYDTQIQQLYVAYFNRPADASGIAHWANYLATGGTVAQISAAFSQSLEYQAEYSQATNAGVVTEIYQNLFGRAPEATGLAFWVQALTNKNITVANMVTTIASAAQGSDKVSFDSKVVVATAFTNALDLDAEKAGYAGTTANEAAKALLSTIKTAAQATAAIVPATLDAHVAAVIKAGVPFSLETGLAALGASQKAITDFLATAEVLDAAGDEIDEPDADDVAAYVENTEVELASLITVGTYVPGEGEGSPAVPANPGSPAVVDDPLTPADETAPAVPATPAIPAVPAGTLPAVKAALIAEQQKENAAELVAAQKVATTAQTAVSGVTGLNGAIAAATSAGEASIEADQAASIAIATETAALTTLQVRNSTTFNIGFGPGVITATPKAGGTTVVLAELADGAWEIPTGVTAATYPGLTEAVAASNNQIAAAAEAVEAEENLVFANVEVEFRDRSAAGTTALNAIPFASDNGPTPTGTPTLAQIYDELNALRSENKSTTAFFNSLDTFLTQNVATRATNLVNAQADVKEAQEAIAEFEAAVDAHEAALAVAAELESLTDAYEEALAEFEDNDYVEPAIITGAKFGTTGADIFVFDTTVTPDAASITSFGRSGDDVLYVGAGYTLNEGKLTAGVDTALEVFFVQKGANAEIHIETKAFGSSSDDIKVITLTGVSIDDLTFNDGIITL